jgi:hypothetical protein
MEPEPDDQLARLHRLARCLRRRDFTAEILPGIPPVLKVTNPVSPQLTEQITCRPAPGGWWFFWGSWHQPAGPADDPEGTADRITTVLRAVENSSP